MKVLFWFSLFWVLYAYAGYAALLSVFILFRMKTQVSSEHYPFITMVIAAYNEEKSIEAKLNNICALDYPRIQLEVIVVSDASTDRTDDIVNGFSSRGTKLIRQNERRGKTAAQNLAVKEAKGEVLVFSDATTIYEKVALKNLVRHFADPRVGCVGGQERFLDPKGGKVTQEVSSIWKYEKYLRRKESEFNTCIGVSGCIFAIRRNLYAPLDENLIEDFALPLKVAASGYKVLYEKDAVAYEEAAIDSEQEFSRKARIVSGGLNVVWSMRSLLNPLRYPLLSFQIISHKVFRWLAPLFLLLLLISNIFISGDSFGFAVFASLQVAAYFMAFVGYVYRKRPRSLKIYRALYHFLMVNLAGLAGIVRFLKGDRKVIWEPLRN